MESFVMLFLSIVLMVQAVLTISTYMKDKKQQDMTFYWSCLVTFLSCLGIIFSFVIWQSQARTAVGAAGGNVGKALLAALASK